MLDRVISHSLDATRCEVRITEDHPYLEAGRVSSLLALEWGAQTTAIHARLAQANDDSNASSAPARGYVVGCPRLDFECAHFDLGDVLEITARPGIAHGALARYEISVARAGSTCASGEVNVYVDARGAP